MMKKKTNLSFILSVITLCMLLFIPAESFAAENQSSSLINYTVQVEHTGGGTLYWDYGKNMDFFLNDSHDEYDTSCKIKSGTSYKFSKLVPRNILIQPNEGYYFLGFYDQKGSKVDLTEVNADIVRVSVNGIYHYNCVESYDNPKYKKLTKNAYQKIIKTYLKAIYGTTRYKTMDTVTMYQVPTKDGSYQAKFKKKSSPKISYKASIEKMYSTNGSSGFAAIPTLPDTYKYTFKSSRTSVIKINKTTGYATVVGPGKATITVKVAETDTTLPAEYEIDVTVYPKKVSISSVTKKSDKSLSLTWSGSSKYSGYEIQVSNNTSFETITAKKKVSSGKTSSTTVTLKNKLFHNYVRIRPYKTSGGEKVYGEYVVEKIKN